MSNITDKLLHPKFTNTIPHIKPSLKNSIYDVKSEQPTNFELSFARKKQPASRQSSMR